jgi:hypothetical protein
MSLSVLFEALTANPSATVKSCLMAIHLIGLSFGMGAATLLDLVIVRFLVTRKVTNDYCQIVEFSSKLVTAGLILLWLTGMGFLIFYVVSDPVKLTNQKIWAKMIIVSILTLNGVFIHRTVLPLVRTQIGRSLFDGLMARERSMLLASGAVSVTSWYIPMVLGVFPQLNFLPAIPILLIYGLLLAVAIIATQSFGVISARRESRPCRCVATSCQRRRRRRPGGYAGCWPRHRAVFDGRARKSRRASSNLPNGVKVAPLGTGIT